MADFRRTIEEAFGWWSSQVVRIRWPCVLVMLAIAAILTSRIPLMEIETSTEDYLFDTDPAKIAYDVFRDQFGRDQVALLLVEPPEVFDLEFLEALAALHRDLEDSVEYLEEVTSLVNVRSVYGRGDQLFVDDLLEEMPRDAAELAALRARVMSTPSYLDSVVSADGRVATVRIKSQVFSTQAVDGDELAGFADATPDGERIFLTARENAAFCRSLIEVVDRHRREGLEIHLTGQPLLAYALTRVMAADVPVIFASALGLIGVMIVVLFRRFSPVLLAATVVVLSLVSTLGISQLMGIPVSIPTQILPSFMLAVGVGYCVHLLTIFFRALAESGDRSRALDEALRHVGLPVLMTGITTAAGLLSFVAAEMEQVFQLGVVGAIGVLVTLVYSLVFLPAMLAILPFHRPTHRAGLEGGSLFLTACARASVHHPRALIGATTVLAVCAIALLPRLDHSVNPIEYFPEDHWLRVATDYADERMGGMQSLEIVVDTGRENGLHDPDVLDRLEDLHELMAELSAAGDPVGRSGSVLEVAKETHQALNENRAEFYRVPRDRVLIAQELLLFENSGSDDLEELVDSQFSKARVSVLTGWEDGVMKMRFLERVGPEVVATIGDAGAVSLTGAVALIARTAVATNESLIRSYSLALMLITPLMILLIGSLRAGLISMVPNLVPILVTLGSMVVLDIDLDMFTMLGACIAIGLAVDDSIHFITGFRRHLALTGDPERAVELTMETTGRALLFTSIVLVAGFLVLGLSSMSNLANLGLLTAFAIGLAFVLDVTVTPALLVLTHPKE